MVMNKKTKSHSQKNKNRKHRKTQRGGFTSCGVQSTKNMFASNMNSTHQKGGSPASSLVMKDTVSPPVMNDYVTSPRIREPGYDNSLGAIASGSQMGGSPSSDLVMENTTSVPETKLYPEGFKVKGDINSLNLYQTTGGSRRKQRSRKHKSLKHKSRKHKSHKHKSRSHKYRSQRGGASDWISSQYSLGPVNNAAMSASGVGQFSQSMATGSDMLMNPPNLGLAGSGSPMGSLEGANVRHVGSPF
jgi:hypothetical protein